MRLGQQLDDRLTMLANNFGQIGDLRLMVMAGITMMDELDEMQGNVTQQAEKLSLNVRKESEAAKAKAARVERKATDTLIDTAERIEAMVERLAKISPDK